jgi:hypothetical protein
MSSDSQVLDSSSFGVKPQTVQAYPSGANSVATAGVVTSQQAADKQMSLIGKTGGKRRRLKGGASQILVPPMQLAYQDRGGTGNTMSDNQINGINSQATSTVQSTYDVCVGQGASCTAAAAAAAPKGGSKARKGKSRTRKGGMVKWGCMSGGKRKTKKTKSRRKSRRHW